MCQLTASCHCVSVSVSKMSGNFVMVSCVVYLILAAVQCHAQVRPASEYFDVFETDFFQWRLAFRGTAGISTSLWQVYNNAQTEQVEAECRQLDTTAKCTHHFRNNDVMAKWAGIHQVAFVVYAGGRRVAHIVFDGKGSNSVNWFSEQRIVSSSWSDIKGTNKNFFSIQGDEINAANRRFFINQNYGGCPADVGWFVATEGAICSWEGVRPRPTFLYALNQTKTNWTTGQVGTADVIAVFVKYDQSPSVG